MVRGAGKPKSVFFSTLVFRTEIDNLFCRLYIMLLYKFLESQVSSNKWQVLCLESQALRLES